MPFAYYQRLRPGQKATYRRSDELRRLPLPGAGEPAVQELAGALGGLAAALGTERPAAAQRRDVGRAAAGLTSALCRAFGVPVVEVRVLHRRPRSGGGELHGLYTRDEDGAVRLDLWMRTARREQVVAFRTFLRTLLHELCHHLDYALFGLADSFHTEGFYARESHLTRQLLALLPPAPEPELPSSKSGTEPPRKQLELFG